MAVLGAITRPVLLATRALQWSSAVIAMGIFSYFVHQNSHGTHLIYNEVISVISVVFFLPAFISPFMPNILSKFVVLIDMVFSYLYVDYETPPLGILLTCRRWLTSFIFTSQDYDFGSCTFANPAGVACSKKKAAQAFTFLTL
jgi:hypothetical protein